MMEMHQRLHHSISFTHCSVLQVHCFGQEVDANSSLFEPKQAIQIEIPHGGKDKEFSMYSCVGVTNLVSVVKTVIHESCDE